MVILDFWENGTFNPGGAPVNQNVVTAGGISLVTSFGVPTSTDLPTFNAAVADLGNKVNSPSENEQEIRILSNWIKSNVNFKNATAAQVNVVNRAAIALTSLQKGSISGGNF